MLLTKVHYLKLRNNFLRGVISLLLFISSSATVLAVDTPKDSLKAKIRLFESRKNLNTKDTVYINLLTKLSHEIRHYQHDSVLVLSEKALKYSKNAGYLKGEIQALIGFGNYYSDNGEYEKANSFYLDAIKITEKTKFYKYLLHGKNCLANVYLYQGNYEKSLQTLLDASEIATKVKDNKWLSISNKNIGYLYAEQKDYEQALFHLKIAKKINESLDDEVFSAYTDTNLASIYASKGELEYAMYHVNASISVFEKNEIMNWLAYSYEIKGRIYLKQSKYKWALFWYKQSEDLHKKIVHNERAEINVLHGIAEANLGLANDSIAERYALNTFHLSERLNVKDGIRKSSKTLYEINKIRETYLEALAFHELYQELTDTISQNKNRKSLIMLKTKLGHEQQKKILIAENDKALAKQKYYIYASIVILLVLLTITLLIKRSGNIQKRLNKALNSKTIAIEKNQRKLREINDTKDKLFSIIGHDLRGPIGAFSGVLQLLKNEEIEQKEFLKLIPKLGADIDHISFTLNNLLSWGQSQMKGAVTTPGSFCLKNIVHENINLLTEIAESKSIKMVSQIPENTMTWSDANQVDIVIRNLLSNALKFTPKNGLVTIKCLEKDNHWQVAIQDTGVGIDQETQDKIFAKNSNITTYGTDNEKGTGLGLTLCKEMVENNKGTIWVKSTSRKGTCFYFTLPKAKQDFVQTA